MVSGPASRPAVVSLPRSVVSLPRSSVISVAVAGGIAVGLVLGPRGRGLERGLAVGVVAGLELVDPAAVDAVAGGDLGGGLAVDEQGGEDQARLGHARTSASVRCRWCLARPVADVLTHRTTSGATSRPPQRQWTLWRHLGTGLVARGERCRTSHPAGDGRHRRHGSGPTCCAGAYGHRPDFKGSCAHALIIIHLLNQARDGAIAQAELAVEEPVTGRLAVAFGGLAVAI
jgi:hypothetical protein